MATKPAILCKLQKGKLIDVQAGFVDTFNWMVDVLSNLQSVDVVTGVSYSTSSRQFKAKTKSVDVISAGGESDKTVFTATPLSGEE